MSEKTFGPLDIITGQDKLWEPLNKGHVVIDNSNKVSDPFAPVSFGSRPPARSGGVSSKRNFPPRSVSPS